MDHRPENHASWQPSSSRVKLIQIALVALARASGAAILLPTEELSQADRSSGVRQEHMALIAIAGFARIQPNQEC